MAEQVELVVRPRRASAALCETADGRFACVLVEATGTEKYFELDQGITAEKFPFLWKEGFAAPPAQVSRSMSTYRSVAKVAMKFDDQRDQMIVLVCPKEVWKSLLIQCPGIGIQRRTPPQGRSKSAPEEF